MDTTRATYFAGSAAMVVWSPFLLDEMAGLRNDALPTATSAERHEFLAKNSGRHRDRRARGKRRPVRRDHHVATSPRAAPKTRPPSFVEYMMNDGYLRWLGIAPEGKFPTRGTEQKPGDKFTGRVERRCEAGVDTKEPLGDVYAKDVLDRAAKAPRTFRRWGFAEGQGALVGAISVSSGTEGADRR